MIRKFFMPLLLVWAFTLGCRDGYIALWKDGSSEPIRVFPYSVSSLPRADQEALCRGIRIGSEAELVRLLEDYLS